MRDCIEIASAPCNEECVQVNTNGDYHAAMRAECQRFLELIRKKLGPEPSGARLAIKTCPHDFGTYYQVACYFDTEDEGAAKYAATCDEEAPRTWGDDEPLPVPVGTGEE